jgi:hypothetical protein
MNVVVDCIIGLIEFMFVALQAFIMLVYATEARSKKQEQ